MFKLITRDNVELRTQLHQMDAEGLEDEEPSIFEIIEFLSIEGYYAFDIEIGFDDMMQLWYWTCSLRLI